ncbi:MAG TPA: arginine--tRNA ligase [Candidatus Saccharimonadales bacterium]|nr:arginine--tRNA ligase [Candidatus Saccharimonadales bacterium]
MEYLETAIEAVIQKVFGHEALVILTRPDEKFGDYATNVALQLAKPFGKNPREIGETLAAELRTQLSETVQEVSVAGPGFINLRLTDAALAALATAAPGYKPSTYKDQVVVAEYSDPNPFKVLHAGHLYTSVVGDALANLFMAAGGEVHRVNFGGDVGLHVGKTMWAILQELGGEHPEKLDAIAPEQHAEWMAARYVIGTAAYEDDEAAKAEIVELNKRVYQIQAEGDHDTPLAHIYWTCRAWSYDYFNQFYARIGTKFEKYYPESEVAGLGLQTVREQLKNGVYSESAGAVVFEGEKYGLHTRVFINSHGIPTYEAKDVGLIMQKWQDYHFDASVVITGNDIVEYMKVVLKSIEQFHPELVKKTVHLTHGQVKLAGGVKMSSRKGNILRAVDVLDAAAAANKELTGQESEQTMLAAVKYSFLKQRLGDDIIYDPKESVSLEGNSGPYLQYAHARARSVLRKSSLQPAALTESPLDAAERSLARKISEYPEVLDRAVAGLIPHHICTYLYELAQSFNRFYEHNRVVGDARERLRLGLVARYADTLKAGLEVLGITTPERM